MNFCKTLVLGAVLALAGAAQAFMGFGSVKVDSISAAGRLASDDADYVQRVMAEAARERGWKVVATTPGIDLSIEKGDAMLAVRVSCGDGKYRIDYLDSRNMGFNPTSRTIGEKCGRWVQNLKVSIDAAVARLSAPAAKVPSPVTQPEQESQPQPEVQPQPESQIGKEPQPAARVYSEENERIREGERLAGKAGGGEDLLKAEQCFLPEARNGNLMGMYLLGVLYLSGNGYFTARQQDAVEFLACAAQGGHLEAAFVLAQMHEKGHEFLPKDLEKALGLYRQLAAQGHEGAKQRLLALEKSAAATPAAAAGKSPESRFCTACGTKRAEGAKFCAQCGAKFQTGGGQ